MKRDPGERNKQIRKPWALNDAELNTSIALELTRIENSLPTDSLAKINSEISAATLQQLSLSYAFLMDGILSYLADLREGKAQGTVMRTKFVAYPEDQATEIKMDDVIVIRDKFSRFCRKAGITNSMQRKGLLDEIRGLRKGDQFPRFSTIGITQIVRDKKSKQVQRIAFREMSFLSYEFETKPLSRVENLLNVRGDSTMAISTIKLQLNYELFKAALIDKRGSGTRGYISLPDQLEMKLRDTVQSHKEELGAFCKAKGFYYLKGTGYTWTIRPLVNMLAREKRVRKDDNGFIMVKKLIRKIAAACCESAFNGGDLNGEFKRRLAVEQMTFALEVMKFMFQDGEQFLEIAEYIFTRDYLTIKMKKHGGGKIGPQLC